MKKMTKLIAFLLLIGVYPMVSCTKTEDGTHVDPITLYEKVKGKWGLNEILQIDETAKAGGISPDEISLYGQFDFSSFSLTLNVDEQNLPTSYEVSGNAPELFAKEGFWELNSSFPSANGTAPVIRLYADAEKKSLNGQLSIVSIPGAKAEMDLKLTRSAAGVPFVSYQYKLTNTNEE